MKIKHVLWTLPLLVFSTFPRLYAQSAPMSEYGSPAAYSLLAQTRAKGQLSPNTKTADFIPQEVTAVKTFTLNIVVPQKIGASKIIKTTVPMGEKIQVKAISGQLLTCEYNGQIFKTSVTNTDYIQQIESAKKQATENERLAT